MSNKHFIGKRLFSFSDNGLRDPVSRVTLLVDDDNSVTAGDDTGLELLANCPYADETLAQALLNQVKGYQYRAFNAQSADLDPAAELGDGVTADGVYSILASLTDNGDGYPDLAAPGDREEEDEYPKGGPLTRLFNRQLATTRSLISKNSESIQLLVERTDGLGEQYAALDVALDEITLTVAGINRDVASLEVRADSIEASVKTAQGDISALSVRAGNIEASVKTAQGDISALNLRAGNIEASVSSVQTGLSQTVRIASDGVTITNAAGSKLTIDGGQIDAENLNLTGRIAFGDLTSAVQNDIDEAWEMAYDAQDTAYDAADTVDAWRYDGGTYIDSSKIMVTTLMATELLGGSVGLLTKAERQAGGIDITGSSSSDYAIELWSNGALRLVADDGDLYMEAGGESLSIAYVRGEGYAITVSNTLMPNSDETINLGNYTYYWADAYISQCYGHTEAASTSDRNKKNSISYDLDRYDPFFDGLLPCIFRLNNGTSGRYHPGLIAQDVEQTLAECGIPTTDFAGFIKMEDSYALRYGEFIALLIWQVQKLKARVKELEVRL